MPKMLKIPKMRFIRCSVSLAQQDYRVVRDFASQQGLTESGFSVALRFIIQDWHELRSLAARWEGSHPPPHCPPPQDLADPEPLA